MSLHSTKNNNFKKIVKHTFENHHENNSNFHAFNDEQNLNIFKIENKTKKKIAWGLINCVKMISTKDNQQSDNFQRM